MKTKKKTVTRIINVLLTVILIAVLALTAFVMIGRVTDKPIFIFGKTAVWVVTPSMEPEIPERSFILVEKVEASEVKVDDVIMFRSSDPDLKGGFNTHRVIEVKENEFITKGDHNMVEDIYPALKSNVVGRYVRVLPVLSALMRFFSTPFGMVALAILLLGLFAAMFVPDLVRKNREKTAKENEKYEQEKQKLIDEEIERLKKENGSKEDK